MSDPAKKTEVLTAYDRWARTYDSDPNKTREMAAAALRHGGLKITGSDVIEIGCGTGRNTQWLAEKAAGIVALDFSAGMLQQAKARMHSPHVNFVQQDIRSAWPISEASADVVVIMLVLEHIESLDPIFKEAARALRIGGELFLCELHPARQLSGRQAEFTDTDTGEHVRVPAYLHDISEFINAGLKAGFELVHLGELRDPNAHPSELPRVLTVRMCLREGQRQTPVSRLKPGANEIGSDKN
ncbi:MAG: class I SAM-dependent methyltransferase [Acidobacteriota bacterium]|nr:class I SAM-dependent methyltransferase [Acidobacteriota bacterium]